MKIVNVLDELKDLSVNELNHAVEKYLEKYSFSTIDILLTKRKILSLETKDLYQKIIINNRGGYCFEQNKLFNYFLQDRGIKVNKQLARVVYGKDIDAPRTHRINIITIDQMDYLVDVGFGAYTPNAIIPLDGSEVKCPNDGLYKITEDERGVFTLKVLRETGFFSFYTFDMGVYTEADFVLSSYYSNTHPNSKHSNNLVMSINKGSTTIVILNEVMSTFTSGGKTEEKLDSANMLQEALESNFKLNISTDEAVFLFDNFPKN